MFVIIGCFNWIGFHLLETLLQNGEEVIGVDQLDHPKREHLSMFVGRNANFTYYETLDQVKKNNLNNHIQAVFMCDQVQSFNRKSISSLKYIQFFPKQKGQQEVIEVKLPLLYGEWMDRDENGIYNSNEFIQYDSALFKEKAIYIKDFIGAIIQLSDASNSPSTVSYYTPEQLQEQQSSVTDLFILPSNSPTRNLEKVEAHYQRFNEMY
ncbi:hypothetical protein GCM10011351_08340 [Paraliobacillus quinghaiensis]|uniref:Uncharacterized protein n=1 Tax=Paraliobacillus quinghaiensis TaxID=470815 RepID=A0A917TJJ8_9BACI|nr:NAD-dependent epimerase/dehydratase family protein [Paraliobacillus quinghaiensis]GGM24982.1 hypothetical protein GCM10011351_08340 [Paraliobacillus quinghaiensis]